MYILCTFASTFSDVDECAQGTDNCAQRCINTEGAYSCVCSDGYEGDGFNCQGKVKVIWIMGGQGHLIVEIAIDMWFISRMDLFQVTMRH